MPPGYRQLSLYNVDSILHSQQRTYLSDALPPGEWQLLIAKRQAPADGYRKVELIDEGPQPAYFDDLLLRIAKDRGIQENPYDPCRM